MKTEPNASLTVAPPTPRGRLEFFLRNVLMPAMPTMMPQASSDTVRGAVAVVNRSKRRGCGELADDVVQLFKQQAAVLKKLSDRNTRLHEQLQTAKDELASLKALHALETETHTREKDGLETQLRDLQDQIHVADQQNDSMMENLITTERDSMAECESLRIERDAQAIELEQLRRQLEDARQYQRPSDTQQGEGETLVELRKDRDQYRARAQRTKPRTRHWSESSRCSGQIWRLSRALDARPRASKRLAEGVPSSNRFMKLMTTTFSKPTPPAYDTVRAQRRSHLDERALPLGTCPETRDDFEQIDRRCLVRDEQLLEEWSAKI